MANKDYITAETVTTWTGSGGGDKLLPLASLAADGVVMGAYLDLGDVPRAGDYSLEFKTGGFATEPVVGEAIPIYFSQSEDGLIFDGAPTTAPLPSTVGTMTTDQLKNILPVDFCIVASTSTTANFKITANLSLTSRYVSPVIHNDTADALANTTTGHTLILTPKPRELQ